MIVVSFVRYSSRRKCERAKLPAPFAKETESEKESEPEIDYRSEFRKSKSAWAA